MVRIVRVPKPKPRCRRAVREELGDLSGTISKRGGRGGLFQDPALTNLFIQKLSIARIGIVCIYKYINTVYSVCVARAAMGYYIGREDTEYNPSAAACGFISVRIYA